MINLRLPWPPTVNSYYGNAKNGRKYLTKRGRDYKKDAALEVMGQTYLRQYGRLEVNIDAYPPDKRKRDIDNILKPLLDVLTECYVWEDDSQIDVLRIRRKEISKPGYVRVHISEIPE